MCGRLSIDDQPLSVVFDVVGEIRLDALLTLLAFTDGLVTYLALPELLPALVALALAIRFATAVYSQLLCRFTQARQGRARSHLVFRSTHSRQDNVGLLRFCFTFVCSPSTSPDWQVPLADASPEDTNRSKVGEWDVILTSAIGSSPTVAGARAGRPATAGVTIGAWPLAVKATKSWPACMDPAVCCPVCCPVPCTTPEMSGSDVVSA
jgi:hypothetical protein